MADFDRGNAQGLASAASSVGHSRRKYDNQGARTQRDQFLTQELTYFVLDTGLPSEGNPGNATANALNQNANIYAVGFDSDGTPRAGERILQVLSAHMNPVIIDTQDPVLGEGTSDALKLANSSGNSRLLYFACESDGLHWDVDGTGNAGDSDYYGEIGANSPGGNAELSTAAKAIRAIRAIDTTDLASAKLSRGYFRVTSDEDQAID